MFQNIKYSFISKYQIFLYFKIYIHLLFQNIRYSFVILKYQIYICFKISNIPLFQNIYSFVVSKYQIFLCYFKISDIPLFQNIKYSFISKYIFICCFKISDIPLLQNIKYCFISKYIFICCFKISDIPLFQISNIPLFQNIYSFVVSLYQIVVYRCMTFLHREDMSQASVEQEPLKPQFTQLLPPTRSAPEGSRVRLDCVIIGNPEPEVIWFKNDKPIKESKNLELLFEGDRCILVLREAMQEDRGTYQCVARNPHGEAESSTKLHVERTYKPTHIHF